MTWFKISSSLYHILILINIYVLTIATVTNQQNVSNSDCYVQKPNESNILWYEKYQVVDSVHATFRLWRAYYDDRPMIGIPTIRIAAAINRYPAPSVTCYFWAANDSSPMGIVGGTVESTITDKHQRADHALETVLVSCPISRSIIPEYVSISMGVECKNATNILRIENDSKTKKGNIVVCVRLLQFDTDYSLRLIEWIEMVRILGADHIYFNLLYVHPNMSRILDHYVSTGFVSITKWTLPGNDIEERYQTLQHTGWNIERANENIPLQDCLLKCMNSYKYLIKIDLDEVIIPIVHKNWIEMIEYIDSMEQPKRFDSYAAIRSYFLDSDTPDGDILIQYIPNYLHMMRHLYRGRNRLMKVIVNLDRCVSIF